MANVLSQLENNILTITINRPDKLNALNQATLKELDTIIQGAADDDNVACIVITGSGDKAFVAGADISELATTDAMTGMKFARFGQSVFNHIENCGKPVIAAVNGFALGGGCELAMACHLRIASDNAKFGQPEIKLGVIPGFGGTQRLTRLVGKSKSMEMNLLGDMVSADKAEHIGLINWVVPQGELMASVTQVAQQLAASAPIALSMTIDAINKGLECALPDALDYEVKAFGICCASADKNEGTSAFLEKRKAKFQGK
ncbi:enoyl-CoA hydratase/isomerase family protein [Marinicella litoralis]|uniref:Short chain enoyl-CoA hydratase n=1 Tax=Marinicella litoralis TaxID=644220 RepID=A0A4R6XEY5_9GAMM|nr:enoyl-CoA hydratase-related protein [Marinicella litoralis]TDR16789.1 short chain enoyl-CoA hydratase [Marinicella litoralis]